MTVQEIINMAIQRSNLNDPDLIPETELLDYVTAYERLPFLEAARHNPNYFGREGNTAARSSSTDSWSLSSSPGNIAAVTRVEVAAITGTVTGVSVGTEVNVIDIRFPHLAFSPRAYIRDRVVRQYNSELAADTSNYVTTLKVFYSYLSTDKTSTADSMELPDEYNLLVVLPLAATMADRDQRPEEAQRLLGEYSLHRTNFLLGLGVYDETTIRSLDQLRASAPGVGSLQAV